MFDKCGMSTRKPKKLKKELKEIQGSEQKLPGGKSLRWECPAAWAS